MGYLPGSSAQDSRVCLLPAVNFKPQATGQENNGGYLANLWIFLGYSNFLPNLLARLLGTLEYWKLELPLMLQKKVAPAADRLKLRKCHGLFPRRLLGTYPSLLAG